MRGRGQRERIWNGLPTLALVAFFAAAAIVIFFSGLRMTGLADCLDDRTGLGEAIVGGVLFGAATSLSSIIVSTTAALDGRASLAFSNSVGGIAAQTVFLAVADLFYRKINLEHAAADLGNVFQGRVLMVLATRSGRGGGRDLILEANATGTRPLQLETAALGACRLQWPRLGRTERGAPRTVLDERSAPKRVRIGRSRP